MAQQQYHCLPLDGSSLYAGDEVSLLCVPVVHKIIVREMLLQKRNP